MHSTLFSFFSISLQQTYDPQPHHCPASSAYPFHQTDPSFLSFLPRSCSPVPCGLISGLFPPHTHTGRLWSQGFSSPPVSLFDLGSGTGLTLTQTFCLSLSHSASEHRGPASSCQNDGAGFLAATASPLHHYLWGATGKGGTSGKPWAHRYDWSRRGGRRVIAHENYPIFHTVARLLP